MPKHRTSKRTARGARTAPVASSPPPPPFDPDKAPPRMIRREAAAYLTAIGYPIAVRTLAQMAWGRSPGPPYRMFNARCLYDKTDLLAWAEARMSPKACSTSEHEDLARQVGAQKPEGNVTGTARRSRAPARAVA